MPTQNPQMELAQWACDEAIKAGAPEARVSVSRTRYVNLEYRDRRVETLEESMESGLSLSLYIDGQFSSHRTSDLRKDALQKFMRDTVAMTKYLTPDEYRTLPDPKYYTDRATMDLDLVDPKYPEVSADSRHEIARKVEEAALERGGDKIISVTAGYYDSLSESAVVASNGFRGTTKETAFWCGAEATAKDEGDRRPEDWWWEGGRHREILSSPTVIGRKAVERALSRVGAEKIATGTMPMIVENRTVGRLLRFMSGALYARNLQQSNSFFEGKVGEKIGSDLLTVIDDPFLSRGQNSRLFDSEGLSAKKMPVFEKGVLRNFYVDTYYGKKLDMAATTGSPSNVTFETGTKSQEEWMKELGRGILVTGFLGGNSNSATGDFSTGIQGYLFENGEIVKPVSELNLAGNHLEFWKKLVGLGNDPYPFSSMVTPSFVFEDVAIAGA